MNLVSALALRSFQSDPVACSSDLFWRYKPVLLLPANAQLILPKKTNAVVWLTGDHEQWDGSDYIYAGVYIYVRDFFVALCEGCQRLSWFCEEKDFCRLTGRQRTSCCFHFLWAFTVINAFHSADHRVTPHAAEALPRVGSVSDTSVTCYGLSPPTSSQKKGEGRSILISNELLVIFIGPVTFCFVLSTYSCCGLRVQASACSAAVVVSHNMWSRELEPR